MTASIERAGLADLETLVALAVAFRDHRGETEPSETDYRHAYAFLLIDPASEVLIARAPDGRALGFVLTRDRRSAERAGTTTEIEDLFVHDDARRAGVGGALLDCALARASARGIVQIGLTTNERNTAALALYRSRELTGESARWGGARALWLYGKLAPSPHGQLGATLLAIDHVQLAMPPGGEAPARAFYVAVLGLVEIAKPAELAARGGCWFERGPVRVHLGVEPEFRAARKAHPAFRVADVPGLVARARGAGFAATDPEVRGAERRAYLDDAFGNRIEIVEFV